MGAIPTNLSDNETAQTTVRVPLEVKERINEIAFEESEPNDRVNPADVIRLALAQYIERYDEENQ